MLEPYKDTKGKVRLTQPEQYAARKHVIENLIVRELLYQEGCRKGLEASQAELQHGLEATIQEQGSEQQFKAMLMVMGLTLEEYRASIRKDIIINKLAASLVEGKRKPVTTEDARAYYDEHKAEMKGPETRRVLQLTIPLDRYADPGAEKKARQRLEEIQKSVKAFEKFFGRDAVQEEGITAEDLGYISRGGRFHPLLDSIAFRSRQGEISRIIRTEEGLHLVLVASILEEGKTWPFDLIRDELQKKLYEMNSVALVNRFVEKLRKKAAIDIYDRIADSKLQQEQQ
jgi:parvulin-like peptidyl-prolyl isomerase